MGRGVLQQKEPVPGAHKIGPAISGQKHGRKNNGHEASSDHRRFQVTSKSPFDNIR